MSPGQWIRAVRQRAAITRLELARRIGTNRSRVSRWETHDEPGLTTLRRVAAALGATATARLGPDGLDLDPPADWPGDDWR